MSIVSDIVSKLESTQGTNAKIEILRANADNKTLRQAFLLAYEPHTNFYIKKFDAAKANAGVKNLDECFDVLVNKLSTRDVSGHAARDLVGELLSGLSTDDSMVLSRVLKRDMKCGVSVGTINKIWKDLIATYPYMRCCLPKDSNIKKWNWKNGVYIQTKMDGMFCNAIVHDGKTQILSRAGSPFPEEFAKFVRQDLLAVPEFAESVIHGELLVLVKKTQKYLDRKTGNGMLNSCLQEGDFDYDKYDIRLVAWDIVPYTNWINAVDYVVHYRNRLELLENGLKNVKNIIPVKTYIVYTTTEALEIYCQLVDDGEEGGVMKWPEMIWSDCTSKDQVKMKMVCEFDAKIRKLNPGNGRNESTFGSIEVSTCDDLLVVNLSGFTDKMRAYLYSIKDQLPGMIVTGKANAMIKRRGSDKWSMFLGRFVELRLDKQKADDLETVIELFEAAKTSIFGGVDA
jgi:DNA ligase-1